MARKRREPEPGRWQFTVGETPYRLTAYERVDRGNAIYSRVWDGRRYRDKRPLHPGIRDEGGKIVPELQIEAQQAAIERQRAIAAGIEDAPVLDGPFTLAAGFRQLLHSKEGKYAGETRWKGDVRRYSEVILDVLGRDLLWSQLKHAHYRKLWRQLAERHRTKGRYGVVAAQKIVGTLQSAARWLQQEGWIEPGSALPAPNWKESLRVEWEEITAKPVTKPRKPKYSVEEQRKLFAALPLADPRLALAVEIGAELRLGQVPRSRRSDILPHGGFQIGAVRVHGRGRKKGETVILTMTQRHALTRALTSGVLADLEAAWRRGEIEDYYLIPGGYLYTTTDRRGRRVQRAQVKNAMVQLGRTGMRKQWRKLEELAGVEHVEGRNWYGLRRLHADLAEDVERDARVLNRLGGWTHTRTREQYQEEGRTEIAERAKHARAKIRPNVRNHNALRATNEGGER